MRDAEKYLNSIQTAIEGAVADGVYDEEFHKKLESVLSRATTCEHYRRSNRKQHISVTDDHDSNAGTYYLTNFCSLDCFVCELKHRSDEGSIVTFVKEEVWS